MKESFILYTKYADVFEQLSDEDAGILIKAILEYAKTGNHNLEGMLKIIFTPIKQDIDYNNEKYESICERNRENIRKRWNKENTKNTSGKNGIPKNTKNTEYDYEYDNDYEYDIEKENIKEKAPSEQSSAGDIAKASKHKYGEYHHVLLKDEELQALKRDYPNWEELIKYLDEYIEMKGYKAKSHYLCIRKWVVDAVKKKQAQKPTGNPFFELLEEERNEKRRNDSSYGNNESSILTLLPSTNERGNQASG